MDTIWTNYLNKSEQARWLSVPMHRSDNLNLIPDHNWKEETSS